MSDAHGGTKVIGSSDLKKHEEMVAYWYVIFCCISNLRACVSTSFDLFIMLYSQCSITIVQTGCAGGVTGPVIFLMKGKERREGYTNEFLLAHGCATGSTIVMTENAYMTNKAWILVTIALVKVYRDMGFLKESPE